MLSWLLSLFGLLKLSRVDERQLTRFARIDDPDAQLEDAGLLAVAEAERLFMLDVIDPSATDGSMHAQDSRKVIDSILKSAGWGWKTPYRGNERGAVQWCGLFVAACWRAAGVRASMLATFWASTLRLFAWARYKPFNGKPNPKPKGAPLRLVCDLRKRKALTFTPRAGDILIIGDGKPDEGDHICLVVEYDAAREVFRTIEGNGRGLGPDGLPREGIVRGERSLKSARFVYRVGLHDLEHAA